MIYEDDTHYVRYTIGEDGILVAVYQGAPMVVDLGIAAAAVLIRSPIDLVTVRFISIFSKPLIPMSYFSDERRARAWLKKYEPVHENG